MVEYHATLLDSEKQAATPLLLLGFHTFVETHRCASLQGL